MKRYRLKKEVKEFLGKVAFCAVAFGGMALCLYGLHMMDVQVKADAIERCGGEENIQPYYTKEGDTFYKCVVNK